jgi:hypothetical protein
MYGLHGFEVWEDKVDSKAMRRRVALALKSRCDRHSPGCDGGLADESTRGLMAPGPGDSELRAAEEAVPATGPFLPSRQPAPPFCHALYAEPQLAHESASYECHTVGR